MFHQQKGDALICVVEIISLRSLHHRFTYLAVPTIFYYIGLDFLIQETF